MASAFDICECGDYRMDHEGGTGPVRFPPDRVRYHEHCTRFRIQFRSQAKGEVSMIR